MQSLPYVDGNTPMMTLDAELDATCINACLREGFGINAPHASMPLIKALCRVAPGAQVADAWTGRYLPVSAYQREVVDRPALRITAPGGEAVISPFTHGGLWRRIQAEVPAARWDSAIRQRRVSAAMVDSSPKPMLVRVKAHAAFDNPLSGHSSSATMEQEHAIPYPIEAVRWDMSSTGLEDMAHALSMINDRAQRRYAEVDSNEGLRRMIAEDLAALVEQHGSELTNTCEALTHYVADCTQLTPLGLVSEPSLQALAQFPHIAVQVASHRASEQGRKLDLVDIARRTRAARLAFTAAAQWHGGGTCATWSQMQRAQRSRTLQALRGDSETSAGSHLRARPRSDDAVAMCAQIPVVRSIDYRSKIKDIKDGRITYGGTPEEFPVINAQALLRAHVQWHACEINGQPCCAPAARMILECTDGQLWWKEDPPAPGQFNVISAARSEEERATLLREVAALRDQGVVKQCGQATWGTEVLEAFPVHVVHRKTVKKQILEAFNTITDTEGALAISERAKAVAADIVAAIRLDPSGYGWEKALTKVYDQGKARLVYDLSELSSWLLAPRFSMGTATDMADACWEGAYMCTIDIQSGYNHLRMSEEASKYLGFKTPDGQLYRLNRCATGASCSPFRFSCLSAELVAIFRHANVDVRLCYIDDAGIVAASPAEGERSLATIRRICAELNIRLSEAKIQGPTTRATILGMLLDTTANTISVPKEKLVKIYVELHVLHSALEAGLHIPDSFFESLRGRIMHVATVCPLLRTLLAPWWIPSHRPRTQLHRLAGLRASVREMLDTRVAPFTGSRILGSRQLMPLQMGMSDASVVSGRVRFGAVFGGQAMWGDLRSASAARTWSSATAETWGILAMLIHFEHQFKRDGRMPLVGTDNAAVHFNLCKGFAADASGDEPRGQIIDARVSTSHRKLTNAMARWCHFHGVSLACAYIPRELNVAADALSKAESLDAARELNPSQLTLKAPCFTVHGAARCYVIDVHHVCTNECHPTCHHECVVCREGTTPGGEEGGQDTTPDDVSSTDGEDVNGVGSLSW